MSDLFTPGLVDQLQSQWPAVDVHSIAALVREWSARRGHRHPRSVRNPNGLLVAWTRQAAEKASERRLLNDARAAGEEDRYAALQAEIYRAIAIRGMTPIQVAALLELAAEKGFERLNPRTSARLRRMGGEWPRDA